jgi:hypothetical protein
MAESTEIAVRQAWDRRSGESQQAFHAFSVYRDLGPTRTLEKVATALGKSAGMMERHSAKNDWVDRAAAWDFHTDRKRQEDQLEDERRARQQHRDLGRLLRISAAVRITGRPPQMSASGEPIEEVKPLNLNELNAADVARLASEGVRIERLSLGMPTDLSKALDVFSVRDVIELVNQMVEGALARMPETEHEGYLLYVRSIGVGGRNGSG